MSGHYRSTQHQMEISDRVTLEHGWPWAMPLGPNRRAPCLGVVAATGLRRSSSAGSVLDAPKCRFAAVFRRMGAPRGA